MLDVPPVSGLFVPPVSEPFALLELALLVPLVFPPEAGADEPPPGFEEALCDVLADVEVFGLLAALAVAVAPPAAQFVAPGDAALLRAALLRAVVLGCVLALAAGELGGTEVPVPGLTGGLVVTLDESAELDGGELTGGLDVLGALLGDDTAVAVGRQEGPGACCLLGAAVV